MRSLLLAGLATLLAAPLSAHPYPGSCGRRAFVRFGYWAPRPVVVVRPAPFCPAPAPVVVYRPWHRPAWRRW